MIKDSLNPVIFLLGEVINHHFLVYGSHESSTSEDESLEIGLGGLSPGL
jgi:hypothetical protein